ncbi:MAG: ABC transporter permease [Verrucomicrobia bacterium]|nr:ABC transporter permease [Verrucomicrobiota bacterium]
MNFQRYLGFRSIATAATVVLVALTIVFLVFSVLPSDPVRNALGVNASVQAITELRHELGYDRPMIARYLDYLSRAVRLDFGKSINSRQDAASLVANSFFVTARNAAFALAASILASLLLTGVAQIGRSTFETLLLVGTRVLTSIPSLLLAIIVGLGIYISAGSFVDGGTSAVAGIITALAIYPTCSLTEIGLVESKRARAAPFVVAARAMGLGELMVFWRALRPVILTSWMGHFSNIAATIFVSSAVFEVVFSLPGIGSLLARAVVNNDLPVVQAAAVVLVVSFLAMDALFERLLLPRVAAHFKDGTAA